MRDERYPLACVDPAAQIADGVEIGPFSVIGPGCRIGAGTWIANGVTIFGNVALGEQNRVYPNVILGGLPQDKKYIGEDSRLVILQDCGSTEGVRGGRPVHGRGR